VLQDFESNAICSVQNEHNIDENPSHMQSVVEMETPNTSW